MEPKVAVVGTGRHGSGFVAAVLCAADVACGHEAWWNPIDTHAVDLAVDSSFCAVPDLLGRRYGPAVVHVHRHPLLVIASLVAVADWGPYMTVRDRLVPRHARSVPLVDYMAETWVRWTVATLHLDVEATWALDDITGDPATFTKVVAGLADIDPDLPEVWPGPVNEHNTRGYRVRLADITDPGLRDDVAELGMDLGYQL